MSRFSIRKDESGRFPARHTVMLDPKLVGVKAFNTNAVREWHEWLLKSYRPRSRVALVTPCSNVKPYPKSPTSRKIAGMLRRLGLWNGATPTIEWLYLSDLLVLVPYWRAWDYPACCYELHPDEVLRNEIVLHKVAQILANILERLVMHNMLTHVIVFLPKKHLVIWKKAREYASSWPSEAQVKFTLFSVRELEDIIRRVMRASA